MKMPRISLLTLMSVVVVVALDGMAFRSVSTRPGFLVGRVWVAMLLTMPMVNVLAVAASIRARKRGLSRAFLVGFEIAGWAVVGASALWHWEIMDAIELGLKRYVPNALEWINDTPIGEIVGYLVVFGTVMLAQCGLAAVGGIIGRGVMSRRRVESTIDREAGGSRIVPLAWLVMLVAVPVAGIEGYLCMKEDPRLSDPLIARLAPGSIAVVDLAKAASTMPVLAVPVPLPATNVSRKSPLLALDGTTVRVDSDTAAWQGDLMAMPGGKTRILRDHREVRVTLMEGNRKGESLTIPHFCLRPVR